MRAAEDTLDTQGRLADGPWAAATTQAVYQRPYTGDYRIDCLLEGTEGQTGIAALDFRWNASGALGSPVTVTYSFMTGKPWYGGTDDGEGDTGFGEFNATQKAAVRAIFARLEAELGINFEEVSDSTYNYGEIRFGNNQQEVSAGYSWLPYSSGDDVDGDVWISDDTVWGNPSTVNPVAGNGAWDTLIHEIGHALGLKHPGNYNAGTDGEAGAGNYLGSAEDNYDYSVMSYSYSPNGTQLRDWFGIYDLLALKKLYGAGTLGAGDSVYAFSNGSGDNRLIIDDASGFDTLDASAITSGVTVDLRPGGFSSLGRYHGSPAVNNLSIDFTTVIEKFIGTEQADTVTGNDANNIFVLGRGNNTANGGAGIDTASYVGQRVGYNASMVGSELRITSATSTDTLLSVERADFWDSNLAFDLNGNAGTVARLMGALAGAASLQAHPDYVGIGLNLLDGGMSASALAQYAVDALLGSGHSHGDLVATLYGNVAGVAPPSQVQAAYVNELGNGTQTEAGLALFAADHSANAGNINLVGLSQYGLAYT